MHALGSQVGARVLRALDTRGQHRLRGAHGADHQDLQYSGECALRGVRYDKGTSRVCSPTKLICKYSLSCQFCQATAQLPSMSKCTPTAILVVQ